MNGETLINIGQAVNHGDSRYVRNRRTQQKGKVIRVSSSQMEVLADQRKQLWPSADCEECEGGNQD